MAQSNLAYEPSRRPERAKPQPMPLPRPQLRTIEGQGRKAATQPQKAPWLNTLIVMSVIVLIVLATSSVGKVSIANATVHMMQTAQNTQASIDDARAVGTELEVQHSLANNPTRIQDAAAAMGILPSSQPQTLSAHAGFSDETLAGAQSAKEEAQATELALMSAAGAQ